MKENRYKQYCVLKYGNQYIQYTHYGSSKEFLKFRLTENEKYATKFYKGKLRDWKVVVELMSSGIGITRDMKVKYIPEATL